MLKKIMKKANEKKNQKGFTLIELLAVIVILAILAAIAIPSVTSIINKQNDKAKVQDALTVIHAAKLYVADHHNNSETLTLETNGNTATGTNPSNAGELDSYIEKTADITGDYTVEVTFNSGKPTYTIKVAPSGFPLSTPSSETQLINYNK